MDVKIEGENVVRNLDLTTHNHASLPGATPPWPYLDAMSPAQLNDCKDNINKEKTACSDENGNYKSGKECCDDEKCQEARKCMLVPYGGPGSPNCCDGKTGHHLLPNSLLQGVRDDSSTNVIGLKKVGDDAYTCDEGACVCVEGEGHSDGDHGELHDRTKSKLRTILMSGKELTYQAAKQKAAEAHGETFVGDDGKPQCNPKCIEAQIDASLSKSKTGADIQVRQKDGMTRKNFESYRKAGKKKP